MKNPNQNKNYLALGVLSPAKSTIRQATQNPLTTTKGTHRSILKKGQTIGKVIKR
jgi:hypothetical protein